MKSYRKLSAIILTTLIVLCFASCAKDTSDNTSNIQSTNNTAFSQKNSGVDGTLSLENSPVSLEQLRQTASQKGAVCAAAFLGSIEENQKPQDAIKDTDKVKKYPFLSGISDTSFVRQPGKQLYCVVPVDDKTKSQFRTIMKPMPRPFLRSYMKANRENRCLSVETRATQYRIFISL